MPFVAENDVIQKFNTEGLSGLFQAFCNFDILFAWCESAGRVVVGDDDGGGPIGDGIGKDLAGMNLGFIDQADGDGSGGDHFVGAV